MRIDRPHSEILSCQTRGRCEMQNAPPQRHTTTINSIKNTGHKSNRFLNKIVKKKGKKTKK